MIVLPTKLKNAVIRVCSPPQRENLEFLLRTITVNGDKRGCSGFIRNPANDAVVYVNTERPVYCALENYMYRYADAVYDYRGYRNRWADTLDELAQGIAEILNTPVSETTEIKV